MPRQSIKTNQWLGMMRNLLSKEKNNFKKFYLGHFPCHASLNQTWAVGFALGRTGNGNFPGNGPKSETGRTGKWKPRLNSGRSGVTLNINQYFSMSLSLFWYVRNPLYKYSICNYDKYISGRFLTDLESWIILISYCNIYSFEHFCLDDVPL